MKKLLLVTMAACLMMGLFATGAKETQTASPKEKVGANPYGTPDHPVKVTYLCKDVNPNDEGNPELVKAIEEGMAKEGKYIDLQILDAPAGSYKTVVPIAFRTGQISPDLIYFQGGDQEISQEGMLEDLTPYIASSMYVKKIMEPHNVAAMKNYPYLLWLAPARVQIPVMRSDWFDELSSSKSLMENPTVDAYLALFREMKAKNLCKWPITTDGTILKLDSVFNHAFGVTATIVKENGKWVYSKATQAEKNKLAFYAQLYKEGLLDNEYVTKQWDTMEQAFYEGTAGFVSGSAGAVINIYNNKMIQTQGKQAQLIVLPPATGISQAYQSVDVTKESRGFGINADSSSKEAAFAVLDFMAGPEGRKLDKLGIEGMHYTVQDGKIVLGEKFPQWWARFWDTMNGLDTSNVAGEVMTKPGIDSLDAANKYFSPDTNVLLPEDLLPLKDAMDKLYTEYSTDIIRGIRDISSFDEFVQKWNAAGGDKISQYLATVLK
ncbi:MAG: extracellular solute-binding protein [Sphaerochaetaceae bacterium]